MTNDYVSCYTPAMDKIGIGVNVFIYKEGRILLGKRKGGNGDGTWCLPGGKLEFGESLQAGAVREVLEEAGIELGKLEFVNVTNDPRMSRREHYIHFNFRAETSADAQLVEPDKFYIWDWFDPSHLPEHIFYGHVKLIEAFKQNQFLSD